MPCNGEPGVGVGVGVGGYGVVSLVMLTCAKLTFEDTFISPKLLWTNAKAVKRRSAANRGETTLANFSRY